MRAHGASLDGVPGHRILVADPDAATRTLYASSFAFERWDVVEAVDGRDALVKALTRPPSLVVTDLRLDFIDGFSLCHILRIDRATADVPIVVVTDEGNAGDTQRALEAGANVVLAKSRAETLLVEAKRLLERSETLRERGIAAAARAAAQINESEDLRARRHTQLAEIHQRLATTTPPLAPPALQCYECGASLTYEYSFVGGVSERHREQWDYYVCARCGRFQYRHRTRKLRRVR